jgi:hypothetical protein
VRYCGIDVSASAANRQLCAAAYASYVLARGGATWVGDPREGVIVLPVGELLARYDPLPPPARALS